MPRQHRQLYHLAKMLKQPLRKMLQQVRESTPPASHPVRLPSAHTQEPAVAPGGQGAAATATAPPLPARVSSVTGPRDRTPRRPGPLQPPLPPPGRAANTPCTDGDPDLLTGLKFLLKRSSDHRTSGPVGGGQPRTTPWSGTLDLGLGGLLGRKQAPPQGRLPTSSPFRC